MKKLLSVVGVLIILSGCTRQPNQIVTTCTDTSNPKFTQELVYITDLSGTFEGYQANILLDLETKENLENAVASTKERAQNYNQYAWIDFSYTTENTTLKTIIEYDFRSVTPQEVKEAGFTGFVNGDKFSNIKDEKEIENIKLRGAGFVCVEK